MLDIFCMNMIGKTPKGAPNITQYTRYNNTHLQTIKRIVQHAKTESVWVISDVCDYTDFDFYWQPPPWEANQIHCWASGDQQFGDTFWIPIQAFKDQMDQIDKLEYYRDINWHSDSVPRVKFKRYRNIENFLKYAPLYGWVDGYNSHFTHEITWTHSPQLWENREVIKFTDSGSVCLVPREVKQYYKNQMYDYPYIKKVNTDIKDEPLDVVFISNGEKGAQERFERLKAMCPRAMHSTGVTGRAEAYKAAARMTSTDWFIAVFAKCWMYENFDFDFQPDRFEGAKHHIFYAKNPVNGLEYGHMAPIAYHRQTILDTTEWHLDFTLAARHAVVPITACTAEFNTSPYETWRTAFRECVKLCEQTDPVSKHRLKTWRTVAKGNHGEWSLRGANDAVKFYDTSDDITQSREWSFLLNYFLDLYPDVSLDHPPTTS